MKKPDDKKTTSSPKATQAGKAADTTPADTTPTDAKPSGAKPADEKPSGATQADAKPSGAMPADSASGEPSADRAKKEAAKPGTISTRDVGPGDGKSAAEGGGKAGAMTSGLVGDGTANVPPAAPKSQPPATGAQTAGKSPADDKADQSDKTRAAGADADPAPKGPLKDAPPEAILRDTPASTPAPTQNVTVQRTGFWPVALGGAVAAGLGAAVTIWALPNLPASWLPEPPAQEAAPAVDADAIRAEAVSAAEAAAREQVDALRAELAESAAAAESQAASEPEPAAETAAAETQPAPAEPTNDQASERIAELQDRLDQQAARIEELAARPTLDPDTADKVMALADQADTLEQQIQSVAESARSEITAAQQEAERLQQAAESSTRRAEAVAAIASLQAALDRGVTPDEARATLEGAGIEPPDALRREVPSLDSLQADFSDAARAALRASLREGGSGGGNVLTNFLRAQTGIRSVAPREGDDPDAVLSRANAEVEAGQIGAALDEIQALPDAAKSAPSMADWIAGATAYRDAQSALSDLSANSN